MVKVINLTYRGIGINYKCVYWQNINNRIINPAKPTLAKPPKLNAYNQTLRTIYDL